MSSGATGREPARVGECSVRPRGCNRLVSRCDRWRRLPCPHRDAGGVAEQRVVALLYRCPWCPQRCAAATAMLPAGGGARRLVHRLRAALAYHGRPSLQRSGWRRHRARTRTRRSLFSEIGHGGAPSACFCATCARNTLIGVGRGGWCSSWACLYPKQTNFNVRIGEKGRRSHPPAA